MSDDDVITLRDALASDRPFLVALYTSTRAEEFAQLGWPVERERALMKMQFEAQRRDYERRHPGARCEIVELCRCPIGRLWVAHDARSLTLLDISLVDGLRGQGIGAACLRRVQSRAAAMGLDVELQVVVGNPAQRLYERLGFRKVGDAGVRQAMAWKPAAPASIARISGPPRENHHEQA